MFILTILPERRGGTLLLAAWSVPSCGTLQAETAAVWARRLYFKNGGVRSAPVNWYLRSDINVGPEIPHLVEEQVLDQVVAHFRGERIRPGICKISTVPRIAGRWRGMYVDLR